MHKQRLPIVQPALRKHRVMRGYERFGNGGGFCETEIVGNSCEQPVIDLQIFRLCFTGRYPEHPVAYLMICNRVAELSDLAGEFESWYVRRITRGRWIVSA